MENKDHEMAKIISEKELILIYGPPHPHISKLFVNIGEKLLSSSLSDYVILIDLNHTLLPKDLLYLKDALADNFFIYKPLSPKNVTSFLLKLYSRSLDIKKYSILMSSLYIHLNNKYFRELGYDPLTIMALLKAILFRPDSIYTLVNIDAFTDDFFNLPLSKYIYQYVDELFYRLNVEDRFIFKKINYLSRSIEGT